MIGVPEGWEGKWTNTVGRKGRRWARVFFSNGAWSFHRGDGDDSKRSRHDSRENAIRLGRAWLRGAK